MLNKSDIYISCFTILGFLTIMWIHINIQLYTLEKKFKCKEKGDKNG